MSTRTTSHRRDEPKPPGNGVVAFLMLPFVLAVLVIFTFGCEDGTSTHTSESETSVETTPTESASTTRPERPQPPGAEDTTEEATPPTGPVSFETAEEAYRDTRYAEATQLFERYTRDHPNNPWGRYMLGLSAWKAGDLERAEETLRETTRMDSTHVKGWINLARVLLDDGRPEEAGEAIQRALTLEPERGDALRVSGLAAEAKGDLDAAANTYRQAILADDEDAWSLNNLGLIHIRRGEFDRAVGPLARAVQVRDDVPVFQNNLGAALERTGHPVAAAEAYARADELGNGYEKAAASLARVEALGPDRDAGTVDLTTFAEGFVEEMEGWRQDRMADAGPTPDAPDRPEATPDPENAGNAGMTETSEPVETVDAETAETADPETDDSIDSAPRAETEGEQPDSAPTEEADPQE